MNKLKTGLRFIKAKLTGKRIPLFVGWDLTSRCNFNCAYCGVPQHSNAVQELNTADVLDGINQLAELGTMRIHFGGGEVLLREDIGVILKACQDKAIYTALLTNGMLVPKRRADLKAAGMLNISFDGPEHIHDKLRQQGSYAALITALDLAREENIKVTLNVSLSQFNSEYLEFIFDFAQSYCLPIRFQLINKFLAGDKDVSGLVLDKKQQYVVLNRILSAKCAGKSILNSLPALKYLRDYPEVKIPGCCAGKIYLRISENGELYPCSMLKGRIMSDAYVRSDIKTLFQSLPLTKCAECLCTPTLDACLIYNLNFAALLNGLFMA
ncbi:MAG: radical SAM protein [Candidatus Omnitrophica bacterium]|nr:radical SAM protein [Candidatus Omnitrophota bacterium]